MTSKLVKFFVTQKFRFDMSAQFMVFINFALLTITATPHIHDFIYNRFGWSVEQYTIIPVLVFFAFFSTWLFGYILDTRMKYWQQIRKVQTDRNTFYVQLMKKVENIEKELEWLKNQHIKN